MNKVLALTVLALFGAIALAGAQECGQDEIFNECGSPCEEVCGQGPQLCITACEPKCVCKPGYIRGATNGTCIHKRSCKRVPACGINEWHRRYGKETYCNSTQPALGARGCYCRPGFARNELDVCVPKNNCNTAVQCRSDEEYKTCGTCDQECGKPPMMCTMQCRVGCFCSSGHLRKDGACVPTERC